MTSVLPEMPAGWHWTSLGEISEKPQYGWTTKAHPEKGTVKLLRTTDITSGALDWSSVPFCTETPDDLEKYLVKSGDIVISRAGSVGFSYLLTHVERAVFASYLIRFRIKPGINKKYVYYYLKSPDYWRAIGASKIGIAVPNVNATKLAQVPVPLAPEGQQVRIVAEIEKQFSRLDEAVANLKRVKANLKRYKAAFLKAAVEGKLTEEWRKQHPDVEPASKIVERIVANRSTKTTGRGRFKAPAVLGATDLPKLPYGWTWIPWELALSPAEGAFKRGPFGSALTKAIFVSQGYKVYEQYCPINDDCSFGRYYITPEKFEELKVFEVKAGDFLISCSGVTLGRITQVPLRSAKGIINQALLRVRLNKHVIDDAYFLRLFRSPVFQKRIADTSTGTAIPNVKGVKELKAIPIPLPPLVEQQRIVAEVERRLSVIEELEAGADMEMKRADHLRQAILVRSFSAGHS